MVTVNIQDQLTIDDRAAELLNAMTSRRVFREMYRLLPADLTQRMTFEEMLIALNPIWCLTAKVIRARRAVERAIAHEIRSLSCPGNGSMLRAGDVARLSHDFTPFSGENRCGESVIPALGKDPAAAECSPAAE